MDENKIVIDSPALPPVPEAQLHEIVNPVHLAIKAALLPVLTQNTTNIRPKKTGEELHPAVKVLKSRMDAIGLNADWRMMFAAVLDIATNKPLDTHLAPIQGKAAVHPFQPLTVGVIMRGHKNLPYTARLPYIVFRAENARVFMLHENGISNSSAVDPIQTGMIPANNEEVAACVESLTPAQMSDILIHEYFRPILHTVLGMGVDGDEDEESDTPPEDPAF